MAEPPNSLEDDYQFIKFYLANPCDFGLQVYYETFLAAFKKLLFALLAFGLLDVVRGYFRPAGVRGGRHGRKSRRGKKGRGGIPELGNTVAKLLPGAEMAPDRYVHDGARGMWALDNWGQKWLYRIMIVGLVTEFWADWNTGIIQHPQSHCPDIGRACRRDTSHVFNPGGWGQLLINNSIYGHGLVNLQPGSVHIFEGMFSVILSCKASLYHQLPNTEGDAQIGLSAWSDTFDFRDTSSRVTLRQGDKADLVSAWNGIAPFSLSFRGFCSHEAVIFEDLEIMVMQQG